MNNEIIETPKINIEQHVEFDEYESDMAKKIHANKSIFIPGMTMRGRIVALIAHIFVFVMAKLTTDRKWQFGLFFYLLITSGYSTWKFVKWFFHLFI